MRGNQPRICCGSYFGASPQVVETPNRSVSGPEICTHRLYSHDALCHDGGIPQTNMAPGNGLYADCCPLDRGPWPVPCLWGEGCQFFAAEVTTMMFEVEDPYRSP